MGKSKHMTKSRPALSQASAGKRPQQYKAKLGYNSDYGKARMVSAIQDDVAETEVALTEDRKKPLLIVSESNRTNVKEQFKSRKVDMNRADQLRKDNKYTFKNNSSLLPDMTLKDSESNVKKRFLENGHSAKEANDSYGDVLVYLNTKEHKDKIAEFRKHKEMLKSSMQELSGNSSDLKSFVKDEQNLISKKIDYETEQVRRKDEKANQYLRNIKRAWKVVQKKAEIPRDSFNINALSHTDTESETEPVDDMNANLEEHFNAQQDPI